MKKRILSFVTLLMMLFSMVIPIGAETNIEVSNVADEVSVVYYDDGSYLTIYPVTVENVSTTRGSIQQLTASKPVTLTDSSGNLEWEYTLNAEFTVVYGSDSYCLNAHYIQNIYQSGWTFSDGNAYFSDNVATGLGKYVKKVLFVTTKTYNINITLTCDIYGNVT